jgi:hypothetical protein
MGEAIFVGGDDHLELAGRIELGRTNLVAELSGDISATQQELPLDAAPPI